MYTWLNLWISGLLYTAFTQFTLESWWSTLCLWFIQAAVWEDMDATDGETGLLRLITQSSRLSSSKSGRKCFWPLIFMQNKFSGSVQGWCVSAHWLDGSDHPLIREEKSGTHTAEHSWLDHCCLRRMSEEDRKQTLLVMKDFYWELSAQPFLLYCTQHIHLFCTCMCCYAKMQSSISTVTRWLDLDVFLTHLQFPPVILSQ